MKQEQIIESLEKIMVPGVVRSLVKMNLVKEVNITDQKVDISVSSAALSTEIQEFLKSKIIDVIGKNIEKRELNLTFTNETPKDLNNIGNIIAVMSGKGGVGKSLVASLTAVALRRQGYEVGILDADITGPSIPKMLGITDRPAGSESGILPVSSKSGIEAMSINLILPSEDDAVIWRGPLIAKAITQFWEEVLWGKLDHLIVDLPPGTADAPLTVMQTLPVSGMIIVFTPQDLTTMIVRKAVRMAHQMNKPVLGVVENMSYLQLPDTDKKLEIFGKSRADEMAISAQAPLLAKIPIDPDLARLCDEGNIERYDSDVMTSLGKSLAEIIQSQNNQ